MKVRGFYTVILILLACAALGQKKNYHLLIGTYTSPGKSEGIYVYDFDAMKGKALYKTKATGIQNPSYLTISKDHKKVYSVSEMGKGNGKISAFNFDAHTGELGFINSVSSGGDGPCYVSVTEKGDYVFSANYSGGSLAAIRVNNDGSLDSNIQQIQHEGSSIHKDQKKPHVHSIINTPDNRFVIAADLGTDKIHIYRFHPGDNKPLTPASPGFMKTQPGSGPRHLTFHPNHRFLYSVNELDGSVNAYKYKQGSLEVLQSITMLPSGYSGTIEAADIHISPDGKFLYASNREERNEIIIYAIQKNGKLNYINRVSVLGKAPRNFAIDPTGNFLLVANQNTDEIVIFKRNKKSGALVFTGDRISVSRPVCLKFAPIK
ncbi:MAG TPA: lactonase family protein [Flavitalea sp.]|nr:lactonase family protein [Flavitalea sp.]